jgi:hypothetical protein
MPERTVLFIDDKNVYNDARRAFFDPAYDHFTRGGYDPCQLARLVVSKASPDLPPRELTEVRIYTGRPDATRQPKMAAAHDRQVLAWERAGAIVISRPLRYLDGEGHQKGVDVALAIDVVTMAIDGAYDVGVIASTDSDLRPPIEYVVQKCPHVRIEVVAWGTATYRRRLSIATKNIWCHWLHEEDYMYVADFVDYRVIEPNV